jgi:hypothetical protein
LSGSKWYEQCIRNEAIQLVKSEIKIRSPEKDFVCQKDRRFSAEQNGYINIFKVAELFDATQLELTFLLKD